MIAALIEYFTDYEYDHKFYAMHQIGSKYPVYEEIFIYVVFFLDLFIFFGSVIFGSYFFILGIAWICGALWLVC